MDLFGSILTIIIGIIVFNWLLFKEHGEKVSNINKSYQIQKYFNFDWDKQKEIESAYIARDLAQFEEKLGHKIEYAPGGLQKLNNLEEICNAYGFNYCDWSSIYQDPRFKAIQKM